MASLLELRWMLVPFLACLILSVNHVYLGIHVIERKVIFVDLALAQIAALGATYALVLGYDPNRDLLQVSLFSLAFTFVGAGAFAIARMRKEKVPQEAFIGIIYAVASAAAILILSKSPTGGEELKHMLVGDLLLVSLPAVVEMALLYGAIGVIHVIFRNQFLMISIDPEGAEAYGLNIRLWDVLFYMSFGVVIVKSVAIVGVLLVFSYLVVPAVIAQMFCGTVMKRLLGGWLVAILASFLGIVWSFYADYPTGPAVVVMLGIFLVLSGIIYYVQHAPAKGRALANTAALAIFTIAFFWGLSTFKKTTPASVSVSLPSVDLFLNELNTNEEVHQLDAIAHLSELEDPRIVPALIDLLSRNPSEQVLEAAIAALKKQQDRRAIPALQRVARENYDAFLKLSIAQAQLALGDREGVATLIGILKSEGASLARQEASQLLEQISGEQFGYRGDQDAAQNTVPLKKIDEWWKGNGSKIQWDGTAAKSRG
ncbi:MAG: metal ABC transporter permease [Deltaproteobacteria bacterium]|nr:metal ABC transporter permease [Deltaproteobacteria bacterium]